MNRAPVIRPNLAYRPGNPAGDAQGGDSPLVGGAGRIDACQRFWLARSVLPAWGEPARPGLPPEGETGKGGIQFLAAAGQFCRRLWQLQTGPESFPLRIHDDVPLPVHGRLDTLAPQHLEVIQRLPPTLYGVPFPDHVPQPQVQQLHCRLFARK